MIDITRMVITKPTSAYTVLARVIKLVEDEHKRMHMGHWFDRKSSNQELFQLLECKGTAPACGTIGCIAGWCNYVMNRPARLTSGRVAYLIAGFDKEVEIEFSDSFYSGVHFHQPDGSQEQADAVVQFLKEFRRRYAANLKDRIISPDGKVLARRDLDNRDADSNQ